MFTNYMKYRTDNKIDTIMSVSTSRLIQIVTNALGSKSKTLTRKFSREQRYDSNYSMNTILYLALLILYYYLINTYMELIIFVCVNQETILTKEVQEKLFPYNAKGYMGVDKIGRPVYIDRTGQMQPSKVWEIIDEPTLVRNFMWTYEEVVKLHFFACSYVSKK